MAAPCRSFARSAIEGLQFLSSTNGMQSSRPQWCVFRHRALQCSTFSSLHRTEGHMSEQQKKAEPNTEEDSGPEYIPKSRKAKNPMKAVGYAWIIGLPAGIIGFILVKRQVDRNRLQQLKVRLRMQNSNEGEYERERYRPAAGVQ